MKHAMAIRHLAFEDLGNLTGVLKQQDYTVTYLEAGRDNLDEIDPLTPDGHAGEISATPGVSVAELRQETTLYAPALEVQSTRFWYAWLASL